MGAVATAFGLRWQLRFQAGSSFVQLSTRAGDIRRARLGKGLAMPKGLKIIIVVLAAFASLSFLHVWLNIGFKNLGFGESEGSEMSLRVGFLPVT